MLSLWRYGYAVLRHVASGWNNFPPPEIESMNPFGEFAVIFHSTLFALLLFLLATTPFIDGVLRWAAARVRAGRVPGIGGRHGDDAECRGRAQPREPFEPRPRSRRRTTAGCSPSACCSARSWRSRAGPRSAPWLLSVLGEMVACWTVLALFLATGAALRAHRADFDLLEALDDTEQREERRASESIGRRRSIVPMPPCAATCRRRLTAPSRSSSAARAIASRSTNGSSTACSRGTTRSTQQCSASDLRRGCGRPTAKWTRWSSRERCRKMSPSFVPPAAFVAELAAYARSIGRHRSCRRAQRALPSVSARQPASRRARGR